MELSVTSFLLEKWESFDLGTRPQDLILAKNQEREIKDASVRAFSYIVSRSEDTVKTPILVLKAISANAKEIAKGALESEYKNLKFLGSKLKKSPLSTNIPKQLFLEEVAGYLVMGQTFMAGNSMANTCLTGDIVQTAVNNLSLGIKWVALFQENLGPHPAESQTISSYAQRLIDDYSKLRPENFSKLQKFFVLLTKKTGELDGHKLTFLPQHGDFHAGNIFLNDQAVNGVVDWEDYEPEGIPFYDLFYFIRTYLEFLFLFFTRAKRLDLVDNFTKSAYLESCQKLLCAYAQKMAVDPALIGNLVPLCVLRALNIAASPKKLALGAATKMETLLRLAPFSLEKLIDVFALFSYIQIERQARESGNPALAEEAKSKSTAMFQKLET